MWGTPPPLKLQALDSLCPRMSKQSIWSEEAKWETVHLNEAPLFEAPISLARCMKAFLLLHGGEGGKEEFCFGKVGLVGSQPACGGASSRHLRFGGFLSRHFRGGPGNRGQAGVEHARGRLALKRHFRNSCLHRDWGQVTFGRQLVVIQMAGFVFAANGLDCWQEISCAETSLLVLALDPEGCANRGRARYRSSCKHYHFATHLLGMVPTRSS